MENATSSYLDEFHEFLDKYQDPRMKDMLLMSSPIPTLVGVLVYLYLIKVVLPAYMKGRKAYKLQSFIIAYNFFQVLLSAALCLGFLFAGWFPLKYDIRCENPDDKSEIKGLGGLRMVVMGHAYYLSKFTEFMDTILFILRKKDSQVTFLHVYHHSIMPIWTWGLVKYLPDSQVTLYGMINCFVHVVMYFYYMLSAMGPQVQKYLWWKKHITLLQLVQFCVGMIHSGHMFLQECHVPKLLSAALFLEAFFFFQMFIKFYVKAYKKGSECATRTPATRTNVKKDN